MRSFPTPSSFDYAMGSNTRNPCASSLMRAGELCVVDEVAFILFSLIDLDFNTQGKPKSDHDPSFSVTEIPIKK